MSPKRTSSSRSRFRDSGKLGYTTFEARHLLSATLGDSVVTINELMYNPATIDTGGEWIELHNQLSVDVDLTGWRLSGGIDYSFDFGTTIESGEYLVIAKDPAALQSAAGISGVLGGFTGSLSNGGETIHLRDLNDRIMDELIYQDEGDWPVAADGVGASLAKTNEHLATGDFESWHFSDAIGGTPGSANIIADSNLRLSEIAGSTDTTFTVEIENTGSTALNLSGYSLVHQNAVTFALSGALAAGGYLSFTQSVTSIGAADGDKIFLTGPANTVVDGAEVKLTSRARSAQWSDRWQRPDVVTFGSANSFDFEDGIVINEILYNQIADGGRAAVSTSQQLMAFDTVWRYNQSGVDLGQGWATTAHAVGGNWQSGAGLLAVESSPLAQPINTNLTLGQTTYYFETDFTFSGNPALVSDLLLNHIVDDGAIFYLNGVEVGRFNMPTGTVNSSTLATPGIDNATPNTIAIDASQLVTGINRLSVEVHQTSQSSSDVVLGAELVITATTTPPVPLTEDPEEWIELYNNSGSTMDLTNWELAGGIGYEFASGTTLGAGQYLVIANDSATLAAKYPGINIAAGEFSGKLSNSGEKIQLLDSIGNLADEVRYYDDGQWDARADGNGSSLELRDPDADNANGQAWSVSDSSGDSQWQTVSYTAVAATPDGTSQIWNEFVFGLLNDGEILIDDISVILDPGGANTELIQDGSFSSLSTYRAGGNHRYATLVADPTDPGNQVLQLRTTGSAEHILNHVETTLVGNTAIVPGQRYQISYRAKWISGSNQLNTRLYFNYLPHTERLNRPRTTGTPGVVNSSAESNIGPVYEDLQQSIVVPQAGQSVVISVEAQDPDGVAGTQLWYSGNEGPWQQSTMTFINGRFLGAIPGFSSGTVVQFYVEGTDSLGASSTFPAAGRDSRALYKVNSAANTSINSLQIVMLPSDSSYLHDPTNTFSNDQFGATVIDETGKIYYNVKTKLKGSAYGRNINNNKGFWVGFNPEDQYRGVHDSLTINRNDWNDGLKEIFAKHLLQAAGEGVAGFYDDIINFESASGNFNGFGILNLARYGDIYLDGQFEDGSDGNVYNMELLYKPTTTIGGVEGLKRSLPYDWNDGRPDFTNYGSDPELYRYNFQLENNKEKDDFSGLIEFLSTFDLDGDALYEKAIEVLDLDQFVRTFTASSIVGTDDTYTRVFAPHNLRLFENPEDGKFLAMPWDQDRTFLIPTSSSLWGNAGSLSKLFNLPQVSRLFYGHADDILNNIYTPTYTAAWAAHYGGLVNSSFTSEHNYVQSRSSYLLSQMPALENFSITTNFGNAFTVDSNQVVLEGTGSYLIRELQIDGFSNPVEVAWLDDTTWQATVTVNPGVNNLTFRALDFSGNEIHSDSIVVISNDSSALARDYLRVTELNYHPSDPTAEELVVDPTLQGSDFEFVELINTSTTQSLNLQGVQFLEQVINTDNQGIAFTFGDFTLAPGERVVIAESTAAFSLRHGNQINVAGQYSGKLSNGGETITLVDATGQEIQQFLFDDATPWPTSPDGSGSSLNVVDTAGDYSSSANWVAGIPTPGDIYSPEWLLGDVNRDDVVNFLDIAPFVSLLSSNVFQVEADINGDGSVTFLDISPFITRLSSQ